MSAPSLSPSSVLHDRIEDCLSSLRTRIGFELEPFEKALTSLYSHHPSEIPNSLQGCTDRVNHILEEFRITTDAERLRVLHHHVATKVREETLRLVQLDGHNFEFANEELKKDPEIVVAAAQRVGDIFESVGENLKNDPEVVLDATTTVHSRGKRAVAYASPSVLSNENFARRVVQIYGFALKYLHPRFQNNREIVLDAARNDPASFVHASEDVKNNKSVGREAIALGVELSILGPDIKDDEELVLLSIQRDAASLSAASQRLRDKENVVLEAVQKDGFALRFASKRLRKNIDIVFAATRQNRRAAYYAAHNVLALIH